MLKYIFMFGYGTLNELTVFEEYLLAPRDAKKGTEVFGSNLGLQIT